jgi:hypothetical protein
MIDMISPAPCHKHIDVEKISHGKSASSSRTESVDSGERSAFAAKIIAPVCLHLVRRSVGGLVLEARQACRRKYCDRVNFSRFARERINRASSSVTLKLIVFILYYSITPSSGYFNVARASRDYRAVGLA